MPWSILQSVDDPSVLVIYLPFVSSTWFPFLVSFFIFTTDFPFIESPALHSCQLHSCHCFPLYALFSMYSPFLSSYLPFYLRTNLPHFCPQIFSFYDLIAACANYLTAICVHHLPTICSNHVLVIYVHNQQRCLKIKCLPVTLVTKKSSMLHKVYRIELCIKRFYSFLAVPLLFMTVENIYMPS